MGLMQMFKLSSHLISYKKDEKWLHDLMEGNTGRTVTYKKAMIYYIVNANDPEFRNVTVPGYTPDAPVQAIDKPINKDPDEWVQSNPTDIQVDPDEVMGIMGGFGK